MKTSNITCHDLILIVIIDYFCAAKVTIICETEEKMDLFLFLRHDFVSLQHQKKN